MPDTTEQIAQLTPEQRFFIPVEEELTPNLIGMHTIQVDAGQTWLVYRDGQIVKRLGPGRHTWWNGFLHKWRVQKINARVELLHIPVKGRVKGPSMGSEAAGGTALELACDVTAELEIACRIAQIDNFLQFRNPLSVFLASIQNMVVELIGGLSYDQYGQWATVIRDCTKDRLGPGGRDDSERRLGMRIEDVFVTDFKPNTVHDRAMLSMYQLIERSKRELVEAQGNKKRDTVVAESFAEQGNILNVAPSILALQDSPVGRTLIERDADLRKLMVATGLNPGISVRPIQEMPGQLGSGQAASPGYLNPPDPSIARQLPPGFTQPQQVTGQIQPQDTSGLAQSTFSAYQDTGGPPVDDTRQELELSELANADFQVAGRGQVVPAYDNAGRPIPGTKEWVLQVSVRRPPSGYLTMVFHCPEGYPNSSPWVEVKPPAGTGFQRGEPNTIHQWNPGCLLADVAREIAGNTP